MYESTRYLVAGDRALVMEFGNEISTTINEKIRAMSIAIDQKNVAGISEIVPTYRSLMIHYDPLVITFNNLKEQMMELEKELKNIELPAPDVMIIPVLYGGEYGPDMTTVMEHNSLTEEDVIKIHTSRDCLIYMLGFTPGFPYLGGMDERIATPRLETPRTKIKGGSVGIAGKQTGIYSIDSPGGWQLIGWTPVPLYDPELENPFLLKAGNYVRFEAITEEEYQEIKPQIENRTYQCKVMPLDGGESRG
ncbi:MAG: 5-oxoprolinase subunit PxpB [Tindallia sp. MSAO_Bac2]|nr:MAG: 5-oxoprolinase subunit PxpB [Tindallia sp. MSAO_Bac2]